jgi:hypothetical protein
MRAATNTSAVLLLVLAGCGRAAAALAPVEPLPSHRAVVCDASDSGRGASCTPGALARVGREWGREAVDAPRSTLVVVLAGRSRSDATVLLRGEVPATWGPGLRARQMAWQRDLLTRLQMRDEGRAGSAVLEAVHVAWGMLPADGARSLRVLSDLREVSGDRAHNLERRVPRADRFDAWIERSGLRVDLHGADVRVCGLHHHDAPGAPGFGARRDAALRALWEGVFRASGATALTLTAVCEEDAVATR